MHLLVPLILAILAATSTAQSIPTSSAVPIPPETVTIPGTQIPDVTVAPEAPSPTPGSPDTDGQPLGDPPRLRFLNVHCSSRNMPNDNFDSINAAIAALDSWCSSTDDPVPYRNGWIFRAKEAQVYYCNYAPSFDTYWLWCARSSYDDASGHIDAACGKGGGGWAEYGLGLDAMFSIGRDPARDLYGAKRNIKECGF